jgi:hypothetical protein
MLDHSLAADAGRLAAADVGLLPMTTVVPRRVVREQPEVPVWALAVAIVLCLIFAALVVQELTGRSLIARLTSLAPGDRTERLASTDRLRAFYVPGPTVRVGQVGLGARGQDRLFGPGDVVLLGDTGRLVRLDDGSRLTDLQADEGASVVVANVGAWDSSAEGLAGLPARFAGGSSGGGWSLQRPRLDPVGAPLNVPGAPEEELTPDFRLIPAAGARIRRIDRPDGSDVRIRPTGRTARMALEGWDPLPGLDGVAVTVEALVRASEGANVELAVDDVVDGSGTVQRTVDRQTSEDESAWFTLRVQRRVLYASPNDRYSIGIQDVRNRDWLEVRRLDVYLGVLP